MIKPVSAILSGLVLLLGIPGTAPAADNVVLVELFTSQGCSSCPPADRNLGALSGRKDVLGLSLHVDYWDYLGWRDTFARREHTNRQLRYKSHLGLRVIYTPQMVVQGTYDVLGSRPGDLKKAIAKVRALPARVWIAITAKAGMLKARLTADPRPKPCTVWIASFANKRTVRIARGENAGRRMTYHNVVDKLMRVGRWDGSKQDVSLPQPAPGNGVAIWIQDERTGRILAASFIRR